MLMDERRDAIITSAKKEASHYRGGISARDFTEELDRYPARVSEVFEGGMIPSERSLFLETFGNEVLDKGYLLQAAVFYREAGILSNDETAEKLLSRADDDPGMINLLRDFVMETYDEGSIDNAPEEFRSIWHEEKSKEAEWKKQLGR